MEPLTKREKELLSCLRDFRRLNNNTVNDICDVAQVHRRADALLALQPESDDPAERYDAPHRVEHRRFVDSLFSPRRF